MRFSLQNTSTKSNISILKTWKTKNKNHNKVERYIQRIFSSISLSAHASPCIFAQREKADRLFLALQKLSTYRMF